MAAQFFEVEHGTPEWRRWRAGKITASEFIKVMAAGQGTPWGAPALGYAEQIATEILTGEPLADEFDSPATSWGKKWEGTAREEYVLAKMVHVEKPNRVYYKEGMIVGGSPDGLVGEAGGLEIKCPKDSRVHFGTIASKNIPRHHLPQVMGYLWLTGREWWDFASFDPRFPKDQQLFVQRIPRNDRYIVDLSLRVGQFQELVRHRLKLVGHDGTLPQVLAPEVEPVHLDPEPVEEAGETGQ